MKHSRRISVLCVTIFCVSILLASFNYTKANAIDRNNSNTIYTAVERKIEERISLGFGEFSGLKSGVIYNLLDINGEHTIFLVELNKAVNEVAGYMVVDSKKNYRVVEYCLGSTQPLQGKTGNIFYLGPISYAESIGNGQIQDLRTKETYQLADLQSRVTKKQITNTPEPLQSIKPSLVSYDRDLIDDVPDFQQNNNLDMKNDCVPTSGANVMMYWDSHGYPNLSTSNSWISVADRLGVLMNHTDESGIDRDNIVPGLRAYVTEKGYGSSFIISRNTSPTFNDMDYQIEHVKPAMLSINGYQGSSGGHNVTLVGTESYYEDNVRWVYNIIVHDNWESTGRDVTIEISNEDIDDLYAID